MKKSIKSNLSHLSISSQIIRQQNRIEYMERHIKEYAECPKLINRRTTKALKKYELVLCIEQKELRRLKKILEAEKQSGKICISERLETLFKIAKGLKPWLSKEIDDLIK